MPIKILLNGSRGRMGKAIAVAAEEKGLPIIAAIDLEDRAGDHIEQCDVVIDFSFHNATPPLANLAAEAGKALVIGTTGHSDEEKQDIRREGKRIPIVWAGNYSIGVNLLFYLTGKAASLLAGDFDAEVLEMHHRLKKDAPSGTAERLLEIILEQRGLTKEHVRHGRQGIVGARPVREVGSHALRGGDVVGDHTVFFAGSGERLELTHRATSRTVFAQGALHAANWVVGQKPGIYDMQDVLQLRD